MLDIPGSPSEKLRGQWDLNCFRHAPEVFLLRAVMDPLRLS